jgi:HSP20 family molecular chaperone IbpA
MTNQSNQKQYEKLDINGKADLWRDISEPGKRPILLISDLSFSPATDVWETRKSIFILIEIAGISKENLNIIYQEGIVIIKGERREPDFRIKSHISKYYQKEVEFGEFKIKIKMNTRIRSDKIRANYEEGFLFIELPKSGSNKKLKSIKVPLKIY